MDTAQIALLASICFVAMVSPGPDFILVARNAVSYPRRQALATALGIVAGCFVHATYCILGLAIIIAKSVLLFSVIKYIGATYLVYIGLKGLFSRCGELEKVVEPRKSLTVRTAFIEGLLCNVLNPKLALFLLSLFTQFLSPSANIVEKIVVALVFVTESALYWPALVCLLQSTAVRDLLARVRSGVDKVCGVLLIYLGVRVAVSPG